LELLGRSSPAPAQDVARRILGEDVTEIDYTTERVKRMVGKVLTGNGITQYGNGTYTLIGGDELSDAERDALQQLCRQRLDAFREQRGEEVFAHRSPGPLRVLRSSRAPACPGGGPHHPQKPGRLRRHQQPEGPLLPRRAGQLRPPRSGLCDLRAGGQRPGAAGERIRSSASPMPAR